MGRGACHNSRVQYRATVLLLFTAAACTNTVTLVGPRPAPYCGAGTLGLEPGDIPHGAGRGALVAEVVPGGPAEAAGGKKNDIARGAGATPTTNTCEMTTTASAQKSCDPIGLTILRDGKTMELVVKPVDQAMFY